MDIFVKAAKEMGTMQTAAALLTTTTKGLSNVSGELTRQVDNLSRNLKSYYEATMRTERGISAMGMSTTQYKIALKELNDETTLGIQKAQELFSAFEQGQVGIRKMSVLKDVVKDINEMGISAEETGRMLQSLTTAQNKYVDIIERMKGGGKLSFVEKLSLPPNVLRDLEAYREAQNSIFKNDSGQQEYIKSLEAMKKSFADLGMQLQKSFGPLATTLANLGTKMAKGLEPVARLMGTILKSDFGPYIAGLAGMMLVAGKLAPAFARLSAYSKAKTEAIIASTAATRSLDAATKADIITEEMKTKVAHSEAIAHEHSAKAKAADAAATKTLAASGAPAITPGGAVAGPGAAAKGGGFRSFMAGPGGIMASMVALMAVGAAGSWASSKYKGPSITVNTDGKYEKKDAENKGWRVGGDIAVGTITGAQIGLMIGSVVPVIGNAVGAAVGGALGGIAGGISALVGMAEDEKKTDAEVYYKNKIGDYDAQVKDIERGFDSAMFSNIPAAASLRKIEEWQRKQYDLDIKRLEAELELAEKTGDEEKKKEVNEQLVSLNKKASDPDAVRNDVENKLVQGVQQTEAKISAAMEQFSEAISSLQQMTDIERDFFLNAEKSAEALQEQIGYIQESVAQLPNKVRLLEMELEMQEEALKNSKTEKERLEATIAIQQTKAKLRTTMMQEEKATVEIIKSQTQAAMAGVDVQKKYAEIAVEKAQAEAALSNTMRMGMGASVNAIRTEIEAHRQSLKIRDQEVATLQRRAKELEKEAQMETDMEKKRQKMDAAEKHRLDAQKAQNQQLKEANQLAEKFNQLREGYLNALADEVSFGGLDVDFDPTQASGIVNFNPRGSELLGTIGDPARQGRTNLTSTANKMGGARNVSDEVRGGTFASGTLETLKRNGGWSPMQGLPTTGSQIGQMLGAAPDPNKNGQEMGGNLSNYSFGGTQSNSGYSGPAQGNQGVQATGATLAGFKGGPVNLVATGTYQGGTSPVQATIPQTAATKPMGQPSNADSTAVGANYESSVEGDMVVMGNLIIKGVNSGGAVGAQGMPGISGPSQPFGPIPVASNAATSNSATATPPPLPGTPVSSAAGNAPNSSPGGIVDGVTGQPDKLEAEIQKFRQAQNSQALIAAKALDEMDKLKSNIKHINNVVESNPNLKADYKFGLQGKKLMMEQEYAKQQKTFDMNIAAASFNKEHADKLESSRKVKQKQEPVAHSSNPAWATKPVGQPVAAGQSHGTHAATSAVPALGAQISGVHCAKCQAEITAKVVKHTVAGSAGRPLGANGGTTL